jgi:hypothetical protein
MAGTQRVPAFSNRVDQAKADSLGRSEDASRVDVRASAHLPSIYRDEQNRGGTGGQGGSSQGGSYDGLARAIAGANTAQIKALANNAVRGTQRPMFPEGSPLQFIGNNATAASFSRETRADVNRREWGAFRPTGRVQGKFSPLSGMPITFDPNDLPINARTPRARLAPHTTVPEAMDSQVRAGMADAHLNRGNPMLHRLPVYGLNGVNLRG